MLMDALEDKVLIVLIGASIISIILGVTLSEKPQTGWIEGFAIMLAVFLVALVTSLVSPKYIKSYFENFCFFSLSSLKRTTCQRIEQFHEGS